MPKRKDVSLDELLGGKPKSTPAPTQAAPTRKRAPKSSPALKSDQLVSQAAGKGKTRPRKKREDAAIQKEYERYGKPWSSRISPRVVDDLRNIAKDERINMSDLAEFALEKFIDDYRHKRITLPKKATRFKL